MLLSRVEIYTEKRGVLCLPFDPCRADHKELRLGAYISANASLDIKRERTGAVARTGKVVIAELGVEEAHLSDIDPIC